MTNEEIVRANRLQIVELAEDLKKNEPAFLATNVHMIAAHNAVVSRCVSQAVEQIAPMLEKGDVLAAGKVAINAIMTIHVVLQPPGDEG